MAEMNVTAPAAALIRESTDTLVEQTALPPSTVSAISQPVIASAAAATVAGIALGTFSDSTSQNEAASHSPPQSRPASPIINAQSSSHVTSQPRDRLTPLRRSSSLLSWSSFSGSVRKKYKAWKCYAPMVHAFLVIVELLIIGFELHGIYNTMNANQVVLTNPSGLSNETAKLGALSAEMIALNEYSLEQKKWDQIHDYVQTCLEYLKANLDNENCRDALNQVGIQPPYQPKDFSVSVSLRARDLTKLPESITSSFWGPRPSNFANNNPPARPLNVTLDVSYEQSPGVPPVMTLLPFIIGICLMMWRLIELKKWPRWSTKRDDSIEKATSEETPSSLHISIVNEKQGSTGHYSGNASGIEPKPQAKSLRARRTAKKEVTICSSAFAGDLAAIEQFLSQGISVETYDREYGTPLAAAAQAGNQKTVRYLLEHGATANARKCKYGSPIHSAIIGGSEKIISMLLDHGADIDAEGPMGTPILLAIDRESESLAHILLDHGSDVTRSHASSGSPLQAAVSHKMVHLVRTLVGKNLDVNKSDSEHGSALQIATTANHMEMIQILLSAGAKIDGRSATFGTPLQIACRHGYSDLAIFFMEKGAELDLVDEQRRNPLHDAARLGRVRLTQALLEHGSTGVNAIDADLWTPLHHAAVYGFDGVLRILLEHGADPCIEDKFSAHALFRAAGLGHTECTRLLLRAGSPVNAQDCFGRRALHGPPEGDDVDVPRMLLEAGADINAQDHHGKTAIHEAANFGNLEDVKLLVNWPGVRTDVQDNDQATPLHNAVKNNFEAIALLLLQAPDVDVNARSGNTFQEALVHGSIPVSRAMLDHKVKINAQGGRYGSATGAAALSGSLELLEMLADCGAGLNIAGGEFGTPLQAAVWQGHLDAVQWLLGRGAQASATGGRFGCPMKAAKVALERLNAGQLEGDLAAISKEDRVEIEELLNEYGAEDRPFNTHLEERWTLTPGGWNWIPKGIH